MSDLYLPRPERFFRFRFGLKTMFVLLTVFCLWMGWQIHVVHERKAILAHGRIGSDSIAFSGMQRMCPTGGILHYIAADFAEGHVAFPAPPTTPPWRKLLGDEAFSVILLTKADRDYENRVRFYFSEAVVCIWEGEGPVYLEKRPPAGRPRAKRPSRGRVKFISTAWRCETRS